MISACCFGLALGLLAFLGRKPRRRGPLRQRHVERDDQEDDAAGDLKRRQRHAELREDRLPEQGKGQHDQRGDGHGLQRDGAALRLCCVRREGSDQHGRIDGAYDRKEGGEGGERGFEHVINEQALLLGRCP